MYFVENCNFFRINLYIYFWRFFQKYILQRWLTLKRQPIALWSFRHLRCFKSTQKYLFSLRIKFHYDNDTGLIITELFSKKCFMEPLCSGWYICIWDDRLCFYLVLDLGRASYCSGRFWRPLKDLWKEIKQSLIYKFFL